VVSQDATRPPSSTASARVCCAPAHRLPLGIALGRRLERLVAERRRHRVSGDSTLYCQKAIDVITIPISVIVISQRKKVTTPPRPRQ